MITKNTYGIQEEILIKFINADKNGIATNNKRKQSPIYVVIPHNATQVVVDGYIERKENKTYVHYEVKVPQSKKTISHCKNSLSTKLWQIFKTYIGNKISKQVDKAYRCLQQKTFDDYIKKGLKILIAIEHIIKCMNYVFRFSEQQNFDWFYIPLIPILKSIDYRSIIDIIIRVLLHILDGILTA